MTCALVNPTAGYSTLSRLLSLSGRPSISTVDVFAEAMQTQMLFYAVGKFANEMPQHRKPCSHQRGRTTMPDKRVEKRRQEDSPKSATSSSSPPQFSEPQTEVFRDALRLMNEKRVPYAVSGAFALH